MMSRKYRPYGLFCFFTSSSSIWRSRRSGRLGGGPRLGTRVGGFHQQVALPRDDFISGLPPPVPVGLREALDGRARHQERLEHALVHGRDGARLDAFIVVIVPAVEIDAGGLAPRGVENHAEEVGQHLGADALGERLAFAFVLLPVSFDAVAEDLRQKDESEG